jgi:hypothetical protein
LASSRRPGTNLPSATSFGAGEGDCDRNYAYEMFVGLTLHQAYQEFLKNPNARQEDFMFMGTSINACFYYFPVIERSTSEQNHKSNLKRPTTFMDYSESDSGTIHRSYL